MTEQELIDLKADFEESKRLVAEYSGQLNAIKKQFQQDHGCSSIEEAENKIKELDDQIEALNKKIKVATEELEKKLNY